MSNALIVGLDFSRNRVDGCFVHPNGKILEKGWGCENSPAGYRKMSNKSVELIQAYELSGIVMGGEATGYYWLPFYLEAKRDVQLKTQGQMRLFLLNPAWVKNYKRGIRLDHKNDPTDAYYITDRLRTHPPENEWQPDEAWLPLRWFTRLRFRLVQQTSRVKNHFQSYLFLQHSAYNHVKPFSDSLGKASRVFAIDPLLFEEITRSPADTLADMLEPFCHDPQKTANRLRQVREDSFLLPPQLRDSLAYLLELDIDLIDQLETLTKRVEGWIAQEVSQHHPDVDILTSVPGIGPVFASGIAAEIGDLSRFLSGQVWDSKLSRYRSKNLRDAEDAVAKMAGLWWPQNASGQFAAEETRMSKSGNLYLRYYLIQAADCLRQRIPCFAAYYSKKYHEARKHHHKRALVLTARKSLGMIIGLLHRREAFDSRKVI